MNDSQILELNTASDVVDALGGTSAVARLTNSKIASVSNWRAAGRLPARFYLVCSEALAAIGGQAPAALWGIDDPAKPENGGAV